MNAGYTASTLSGQTQHRLQPPNKTLLNSASFTHGNQDSNKGKKPVSCICNNSAITINAWLLSVSKHLQTFCYKSVFASCFDTEFNQEEKHSFSPLGGIVSYQPKQVSKKTFVAVGSTPTPKLNNKCCYVTILFPFFIFLTLSSFFPFCLLSFFTIPLYFSLFSFL